MKLPRLKESPGEREWQTKDLNSFGKSFEGRLTTSHDRQFMPVDIPMQDIAATPRLAWGYE
ncbi:MAG: hypothetical protein GY927_12440 [bacterium]|nr:hypothetical protein [bacterium]